MSAELTTIYKNGREYHIEAEKAAFYCEKYGFSLSLPPVKKKKKRERKKKHEE